MTHSSKSLYNAKTLIASLSLEELGALESALNPLGDDGHIQEGWAQTIHQIQFQRERSVERALGMDSRRPESPPYSEQLGPLEYLAQVRRSNRVANLDDTVFAQYTSAKGIAASHAGRYIDRHYQEIEGLIPGKHPAKASRDLASFLGSTLHCIIVGPRALARQAYGPARSEILRTYLPHLVELDDKARTELEETDLGTAVADALRNVPYATPLPDFFQIRGDLQGEIVKTVADEWLELCWELYAIDPDILATPTYRTSALGYLSLHDLRVVLSVSPFISSTALCKVFLQSPRTLEEKMAVLLQED